MALAQSVLSRKYIRYSVSATRNGAPFDPTADVATFAFKAAGVDPQSGDFVAGSWETTTAAPSQYVVRCLVGPGGTIALAKGTYTVWLKIADTAETPVDQIGVLTIV